MKKQGFKSLQEENSFSAQTLNFTAKILDSDRRTHFTHFPFSAPLQHTPAPSPWQIVRLFIFSLSHLLIVNRRELSSEHL